MSTANVIFETLEEESAAPGAEQRFSFRCPKYGHRCGALVIAGRTNLKRDGQGRNDGIAQWDWDGNREVPTFRPSIKVGGVWPGYIRAGRCVDTSGRDEPEPEIESKSSRLPPGNSNG